MGRLAHTKQASNRRQLRVRKTIVGTASRPRLSVSVSNRHVAAQLIDDTKSVTLASATTVNVKSLEGKSMTEKASFVGKEIAVKAKKVKVTKVAFDRGSRLYHGKVKALADAARENGLEF